MPKTNHISCSLILWIINILNILKEILNFLGQKIPWNVQDTSHFMFMVWAYPTPDIFLTFPGTVLYVSFTKCINNLLLSVTFHCRFELCRKEMYSNYHMSLTMEKCAGHIKFVIPQEMLCILLKMYMKYEISGVTGHVQETYSVLDLGNVQDTSKFWYRKCTGNVIFLVLEMYVK